MFTPPHPTPDADGRNMPIDPSKLCAHEVVLNLHVQSFKTHKHHENQHKQYLCSVHSLCKIKYIFNVSFFSLEGTQQSAIQKWFQLTVKIHLVYLISLIFLIQCFTKQKFQGPVRLIPLFILIVFLDGNIVIISSPTISSFRVLWWIYMERVITNDAKGHNEIKKRMAMGKQAFTARGLLKMD